jgi:3-hydroxybutyryl-CoA dehydrogenase
MTRQFGEQIQRVGVVGLGTMGAGIAEVFARSGLQVIGVEANEAALGRGRNHLGESTGRAVKRGKLSAEEQTTLLSRITYTTSLADVADAELVIEAVPEHLDLKQKIFTELDRICAPQTILATNTSSLSVTEISVATHRPDRVVGVHFFNPAPVMKLVEVIRTVVTDPQVTAAVEALVQRLGKADVTVGDRAGFIANALLFGYLNHAVALYESRYVTREDVDAAMVLGCGLPMGPLALMDLIGIDTAYEILDTMYKQGRDRLHAPAPIIKQMMTAGLLGRKSGRGFYTYDQPGSPKVVPDAETPSAAAAAENARSLDVVGVVGAGTMATGIVEVLAKAGFGVRHVARSEDRLAAVADGVARSTAKAVEREKITAAERDAALARVSGSTSLDSLADADMVIEAVVEDLEVKRELFAQLDKVCKPGAVLATTTSSLPVIECAAQTDRAADVIGLHFFNPAQVMRLVEVVRTISTAPDVVDTARALCERLGKHAVVCGDRAGFVVNALLFPYLNDAVKMQQAHYATVDDIDTAMERGCGYPMGPFRLLDKVGLDVALAIQRQLYLEFREPGFAPAPLLEQLVTAGYLGEKTERGFREHTRR